jgi:signal transduction histidine kinase/ligand-binding sensor domain-containing protein
MFLFATLCSVAFARGSDRTIVQFAHTSWGANEGAPRNIQAITQTQNGYLLLGSAEGLFRFDGVAFEHYETPSGSALPSGAARSLLALPNGDLWIGFYSGAVSRLRDGTVQTYTTRDGLPDGHVLCLAQDREGTIWAGTSGGLARFEGNRWKGVGIDWSFPGKSAQALLLDRKGTLWVDTEDTLVFLPSGARTFQSTSIHVGPVPQIVEAPNGKLWMAELGRSVRPIPLDTKLEPSEKTEVRVGSQAILFARDGDLWITTMGDGLRRVPSPEDLKGKPGRFSGSIESYTAKDGLSDDIAESAFQDREGNIWVGTFGGLDRFHKGALVPIDSPFKLSVTDRDADIVPGNAGDVWMATSEHVARIHEFKIYPVSYPVGPPLAGYRDSAGTIWWVSQDALVQFEHGQFSRFRLPRELTVPFRGSVNITEDSLGVLWAGFRQEGLFYWDRRVWTRFETPPELTKLWPTTAFTDHLGRVWFGYDDGTIIYLSGGKIQTVSAGEGSPVGHVRGIRGRNRQVWVCGESGLAFFDGRRLRIVATADAAGFGAISGIEETSDGSLWLREQRGVVYINQGELRKFCKRPTYRVHYDVFDSLDGLPGTFGSTGQKEVLDTNGRVWFLATNGIAWLNPASVSSKAPPPVSIRAVVADGRRFISRTNLTLPARTTNLQIEYAALSLSIPGRVRYRYELEGADKDWQEPGVRRVAFYTNLGPGKYRFHVNARNQGGEWAARDAVLEFSVAPAWFQTIWFRAFCVGLFLLLLCVLYQLRLNQLKRQFNAALEARVDERTRIARELHDTLLQSFNALLLRLQAVSNVLPVRPEEAKHRVDTAIEQASNAITEGRDVVHQLRSDRLMTIDLAEAISAFAKQLAADQPLGDCPDVRIHVEGRPRDLNPTLRDEVYRITAESLRNACRHSHARQIEVEIRYDEHHLRLRIRDDGKGIDPGVRDNDPAPGHWGLRGMRERAKLVGGNLEIWSELDSGTEVELRIPATNVYAKPRAPRWSAFSRIGRS